MQFNAIYGLARAVAMAYNAIAIGWLHSWLMLLSQGPQQNNSPY